MKEITRIHIARVSYDSELDAKASLEEYLQTVKTYADEELEADVEIRVTELLAERGVQKGGVITSADVSAIRGILGEPKDFAIDEIESAKRTSIDDGTPLRRRLYRDTPRGLFGGVSSGIAAYYGINVLWIRLIMIVGFFVTSGTLAFAYIVLWIALPVAKTSAQQVELRGQSVTVDTIRNYNEEADQRQPVENQLRVVRSVMLVVSGIASAGAAIVTLGLTLLFVMHLLNDGIGSDYANDFAIELAIWLMALCGVLLASLFMLLSYAFLSRKVSRRLLVAGGVIIFAGLTTFTAAGFVPYWGERYTLPDESAPRVRQDQPYYDSI